MNEPLRDDKTFYAPTLTKAEVRFSIVDEYILLRLDTARRPNLVASDTREFHRPGEISDRRGAAGSRSISGWQSKNSSRVEGIEDVD